jgi:hypothetical protein
MTIVTILTTTTMTILATTIRSITSEPEHANAKYAVRR